MDTKTERKFIKRLLASNRYAECPENASKHRFSSIRRVMEQQYMSEWMATPDGLYTDKEIWEQTFNHLLK